MGKLKLLLDEFKITPNHTPRDDEIRSEILKIVDWMRENGHLDKTFKFPKKYTKFYFPLLFVEPETPTQGFYCGLCGNKVSLDMVRCNKCDMGLGAVVYHD